MGNGADRTRRFLHRAERGAGKGRARGDQTLAARWAGNDQTLLRGRARNDQILLRG